METKELLLSELEEAYSGSGEMSLKVSLEELTPEEASWRLNETTWTIEEIVYHVASVAIEYCKQGFGKWSSDYDRPVGDLKGVLSLLDKAHRHLVQCLQECTEESLHEPLETKFHGESTRHFFWVMVMHYISHGAQIRTIRRAYGSRTHFYPI